MGVALIGRAIQAATYGPWGQVYPETTVSPLASPDVSGRSPRGEPTAPHPITTTFVVPSSDNAPLAERRDVGRLVANRAAGTAPVGRTLANAPLGSAPGGTRVAPEPSLHFRGPESPRRTRLRLGRQTSTPGWTGSMGGPKSRRQRSKSPPFPDATKRRH
jgi:hypothetical protein